MKITGEDALDRILTARWERDSRQAGWLRLVGITAWLSTCIALWTVWEHADARAQIAPIGAYFAATLAFTIGRTLHSAALHPAFRWMMVVVDIPFITLAQHAAMSVLPGDVGIALFYVIAVSLFLIASPSALFPGPLAIGFLQGAAGFVWLMRHDLSSYWVPIGALILAFAVAISRVNRRRLVEVSQDYARESRLARYFSPTVADRLRGGSGDEAPETRAITVLFSDLRGFTALSSRARPDEIVDLSR